MIPDKYFDEIKKIYEYEKEKLSEYKAKEKEAKEKWGADVEYGWSWDEVRVSPQKLNKLVELGIIKYVYKSSKHKNFRLVDFEFIESFFEKKEEIKEASEPKNVELFKYIVGYDDLKRLFKMSLESEKNIHILMIGSPATGKTLFLEDIHSAYPDSEFVIGSEASSIGLGMLLREKKPRILLIDEIDKILKSDDLSTLLSVMESGKTKRVKGDRITDMIEVNVKVFAAGNSAKRIPPELASRFLRFDLKPYTKEQFFEVSKNYLVHREDCDEDLAEYITQEVWKLGKDIRTARSIARLSKNKDDADFVVKTIKKYGRVI